MSESRERATAFLEGGMGEGVERRRAEAAEARVAELESALRTIANTNGAQGVLAVNVAKRVLAKGQHLCSPGADPTEPNTESEGS